MEADGPRPMHLLAGAARVQALPVLPVPLPPHVVTLTLMWSRGGAGPPRTSCGSGDHRNENDGGWRGGVCQLRVTLFSRKAQASQKPYPAA